jgi:acetyl esterase/lipase
MMASFLLLVFSGFGVSAQSEKQSPRSGSEKVNRSTFVYRDTLKLDFYSLNRSFSENRPLIILVHGGGFSSGKRDGADEAEFSRKMARKGYAVASISYRLTRKGESFGCDCPAQTKIGTFVKASGSEAKWAANSLATNVLPVPGGP